MQDFRNDPLTVNEDEQEQQEQDSIMSRMRMREGSAPKKYLMDLFKTVTDDPYLNWVQMDAQEFATKWLPLFHLPNFPEKGNPLFVFVDEVTGSPYRGCLLTQGGKVVCIVPPIFDSSVAPALVENEDQFINQPIGQSLYQSAANRDTVAQSIIQDSLIPLVNKQPRVLSKGYFMMDEVFKFFGVERITPDWVKQQLLDQEVKVAGTPMVKAQPSADDYDDMEEE